MTKIQGDSEGFTKEIIGEKGTSVDPTKPKKAKVNDEKPKSEKEWDKEMVFALRPPHPEDGRDRSFQTTSHFGQRKSRIT